MSKSKESTTFWTKIFGRKSFGGGYDQSGTDNPGMSREDYDNLKKLMEKQTEIIADIENQETEEEGVK